MNHRTSRLLATIAGLAAAALGAAEIKWPIHDRTRPQPRVVTPGTGSTQEQPGKAPSDAILLFDGKDLSKWESDKGGSPAAWKVENGYFEVAKGTGGIRTKESFGDCQLHVEWMAPKPPVGEDQDRGNSGVFLMGKYEVQVLDSYQSQTYPDGQASALYGQYPPLVNANRPPGEWQMYDIVFFGPRFDKDGKLTKPAYVTVFLNGLLTQYNVELTGPTAHKARPPYEAHPEKLPIGLQDHNHPVRFRNLWVRPVVATSD
jgi:hypothetical protein